MRLLVPPQLVGNRNSSLPEKLFAGEELENIIANFKESDSDGDGKVTREELKKDMKENKVPEDQIDSLVEEVGTAFIVRVFKRLLILRT